MNICSVCGMPVTADVESVLMVASGSQQNDEPCELRASLRTAAEIICPGQGRCLQGTTNDPKDRHTVYVPLEMRRLVSTMHDILLMHGLAPALKVGVRNIQALVALGGIATPVDLRNLLGVP